MVVVVVINYADVHLNYCYLVIGVFCCIRLTFCCYLIVEILVDDLVSIEFLYWF